MKFIDRKGMDAYVTEWCNRKGLILRSAGNGLWLCSVLPAALLCNIMQFTSFSELYKIMSILSIGQFISSVCSIMHNDDIPYIPIGYIFSSTTVSLLLVLFSDRGRVYSLCVAIITSISYPVFVEKLIKSCPKSFTYGEAVLISQSLILFLASFITNIIISFEFYVERCESTASFILQAGHFAVLVILVAAYQFPNYMHKTHVFLLALITSFFTFVYFIPYAVIEIDSLLWLFQLVNDRRAVILVFVWILCCSCAIYFLCKQTRETSPATSTNRKSFHFLVVVILLSGLIFHPCLIYIASGIAFALLVTIEIVRKLKVSDYSKTLQLCFDTFKDTKDEGEIALTPLYLMIGCAAPIWIYPFPFSKFIPISVMSGILTVGIGDAMASICGSWFGNHRWPNSLKTIEGTFCCFISQIIILLLLNSFSILQEINIKWALLVVAITSLIEATTDQIDNLILPFIGCILRIQAFFKIKLKHIFHFFFLEILNTNIPDIIMEMNVFHSYLIARDILSLFQVAIIYIFTMAWMSHHKP